MSESKKPRICEVLGVEVDEVWECRLYGMAEAYKFRIRQSPMVAWQVYAYHNSDNGDTYEWVDVTEVFESVELVAIMDNPQKIKRKSRWTADDIADAKAVRRLWPGAQRAKRIENNTIIYNNVGIAITCMYLDKEIIPSIQLGESVDLDVILEAENG